MEQSCRAAFELYTRMKKKRLGFEDVRHDLENLAYLLDYLAPSSAAATLAGLLRRLICIIEDVASKLESLAGSQCTDWAAVGNFFERKQNVLERTPPSPIVLPKMAWITDAEILGAGGFGACFKALFSNAIRCTVKCVPDNMYGTMKYACVDKVVASMTNHPLLVHYYAIFPVKGAFVTIMEYIRGLDLDRIIRAEKGLPMNVIRVVLAQLGLGLQYIHYKGFIHRDIKPSNMMIMPGCRLKIIDFDTAKICIGKFTPKTMKCFYRRTATEFNDRESAGTTHYFPPEFHSPEPYGRSVDWWAVGVTAYQMCFDKRPFDGSDSRIKKKVLAMNYKFPRKGPSVKYYTEFKDFVTRLLRKKGRDRLCSKRYTDFHLHPLFTGLSLAELEKGTYYLEYEGITNLMVKSKEDCDSYSPKISEKVKKLVEEYLVPKKMVDLPLSDHSLLYTYVSKAFEVAMEKIRDGIEITPEDVISIPELGIADIEPLPEAKYKFIKFFK